MTLQESMPQVYDELLQVKKKLENHFRDVCEFEFIIEKGKVFILGARPAKGNPIANLRFALQLLQEKVIGVTEALTRVKLCDISAIAGPKILNESDLILLGYGIPASPGAATGRIKFFYKEETTQDKQPFILVLSEAAPSDFTAFDLSRGALTSRGGKTSHAAIIARGMGKPCVAGCDYIRIFPAQKKLIVPGHGTLNEGDWITIDGSTDRVYAGRAEIVSGDWRDYPELITLFQVTKSAICSGLVRSESLGKPWRLWDFFVHRVPLVRNYSTYKKPISRTHYTSFVEPTGPELETVLSDLVPIPPEDRDNFGDILLSLGDSLSRLLASALGIGQHHLYFRPL